MAGPEITAPGAATTATPDQPAPAAAPAPLPEPPAPAAPAVAPEPAALPETPEPPALTPSPEGDLVSAPRREAPDVGLGEVIGAGARSEAIEIDYWMMTDRRRAGYIDQAAETARELGYDWAPMQEGYGPSQNVFRSQFEDRRMTAILEARRAHPDRFVDMPVTDTEMEAALNAELKAEYEDAQATLGAAPEGFLSRTAPEFIGRMGPAATDQVNAPLALATLGTGAAANLGRLMLIEGGIAMLGEAGTLPRQFDMAERLDIEDPNVLAQLALAGTIGAAFPLGIEGARQGVRALRYGGRGTGLTDRELVKAWRSKAQGATAGARAAMNALERKFAAEDVGPAARGVDQPAELDRALEDMAEGRAPAEDIPPAAADRVETLTTPPKAEAPVSPAPDAASGAAPTSGRLEVPTPPNTRASVRNLIRDGEAGGYDVPSSYTVVPSEKPLTRMTLGEVDAWQAANQAAGAESTAAGGYQIIRATLQRAKRSLGLSDDTLFDEGTQDRLADWLLDEAGMRRYEAGEIDAGEMADQLAEVWAAFPDASGRSVYAGDGLNAARVDRQTVLGVLGGDPYSAVGRPPPRMSRVPAREVLVDPRTYQFRTEVDESGVGTALDRVSEWDELLAGDFIIHERSDGQRYIADGHHRRQLAGRLEAEGHAPIEFNAFVLREADGYSVEQVRAIAAVKNIEAGNATAIDAAKVLRVDPEMLAKLSLRNSHARDARGLMKLSDDGFDMVTNRLVREDHAAFVGELTRDPEMQEAVLRALIASSPRNMAEARQIARDAQRAGLARQEAGAQGSLFGDDFDVQETLFKERAAVLSKALTQLRNDRKVFRTLVKERDRIREAGNELTEETNAARVQTDDTALELIERLVNRAGPLDDALNAAARTARGGSTRAGVTDFLATVRGAIEGGDLARLLDGEPGGNPNARAADGGADAGARGAADAEGVRAGAASEATEAGEQTLFEGIAPITERARLEAAGNAALRGGEAEADFGLFDAGARDQMDMFGDGGRAEAGLGDAFDDPSPTAPAVMRQMDAAENDLRRALEDGLELEVPTGREIDGEAELMSAADLLADLDADADFLGALDVCKA